MKTQYFLILSGDPLFLPKRRKTASANRGTGRHLPPGARVLPAGRADDPPIQGEGGLHDGEEAHPSESSLAAVDLAAVRGTGQFMGSQDIRRHLGRLHHYLDRQLLHGDVAYHRSPSLHQRHH